MVFLALYIVAHNNLSFLRLQNKLIPQAITGSFKVLSLVPKSCCRLGATFIMFSIVMFHTVFISSNPWRANRMYRFLGCTCLAFCSIDIQNMVIGFVQKGKLGAVTGTKKRVKMQTFSK